MKLPNLFKSGSNKPSIILFVIIGGLAFLLGSRLDCGDGGGLSDDKLFPKDTTYIFKDRYVYDTIHEPYRGVIPTITVYKEKLVTDSLVEFEYITNTDTVIRVVKIREGILDTSLFSSTFLTFRPKNPKLIRGSFKKEKISLDLLSPQGKLTTSEYPVNFNKYNYTWEEGQLKATPTFTGFFSKFKFSTEASTGLTYNPFRKSTRLDLQGTIWYGKAGLTSYIAASTNTKPNIDAGVGVRIKIK